MGKRDMIIFGERFNEEKYLGGIRYFEDLKLEALDQLVKEGYLDVEDAQNAAPTAGEIIEFIRKYPDYTAHGYAVSFRRDDCRVSLEGVAKNFPATSINEFEDFMSLFKDADEIQVEAQMYCWFD